MQRPPQRASQRVELSLLLPLPSPCPPPLRSDGLDTWHRQITFDVVSALVQRGGGSVSLQHTPCTTGCPEFSYLCSDAVGGERVTARMG